LPAAPANGDVDASYKAGILEIRLLVVQHRMATWIPVRAS
jgi:hypothetical protein